MTCLAKRLLSALSLLVNIMWLVRAVLRKKAAAEPAGEPSRQGDASDGSATRCSQTWAMLIKRVYEIDPLTCPHCSSQMKVVAFIEPPPDEVVEKILRHCGLWQASAPRAPPDADGLVPELDSASSDQLQELTYVDMDTLLATL